MKLFGFLILVFSLGFLSCSDEEYYDINDYVNGTIDGGGGSGDGNGFTFQGEFYSTSSLAYQAESTLTFSPPVNSSNPYGSVIITVGNELMEGASIDLDTFSTVNITLDPTNPAGVDMYQSTGGTVTINALNTEAKSIDVDYTIETAEGNAVGSYEGTYIEQ